MNIFSYAITHPGNKRQYNQDAYFCDDKNGLWAIADGMGGHDAGDIASQTIIQSIANLAQTGQMNLDILTITSILEDVNEQIFTQNVEHQRMMGSTIALVYAEDKNAICLWAGDSRVYLLRDNHLLQLSTDHSYIQELKNSGTYLDQATTNKKNNIITRAIGASAELKCDYRELQLEADDKLLICSDGLYNEMSNEEIGAILQYSADIQTAGKNLLDVCLSREAKDNIGLIVLEVYE